MRVEDIMTHHPVCCTPSMSLRDAAVLMRQFDCGALPVVEDFAHAAPIGMLTDRDIVCRCVADGKSPAYLEVESCMTTGCVTVTAEMHLDACRRLLEEHRIRRAPVVDSAGICFGIVTVADFARKAPRHEAARLVQELSRSS